MSQEYIKGAISCSSGVSYTGSNGQTFVKLQAVGVTNTVRAEIVSMMPQIQNQTLSAVAEARMRGGKFAKAFS